MMHSTTSSNVTSIFTCKLNPQYLFDIERARDDSNWSITVFILTLNAASSIVATFFNLLILVGILTSPKKRTPTFILLGNLAFADFLIGIAMGPSYAISIVLSDFTQVCASFNAFAYLGVFLGSSSLYTLTCISYDRYLSIEMQTKYRYVVTNKRAYKATIAIWLVSLLGPLFMAFLSKWSLAALVCCVQVLCLLIIVDCYVQCFKRIKSRRKEIKISCQERYDIIPKTCTKSKKEHNAQPLSNSDVKSAMDNSGEMQTADETASTSNSFSFSQSLKNPVKTEDVSKDKDISIDQQMYLLKAKKQSSNMETERRLEGEDKVKDMEAKPKWTPTNKKLTLSTSETTDVKKRNLIKKGRRPHSLLTDIKQFRKSLNTIVIIVFALFICYLPFLIINLLVTLKVTHIDSWYDLVVNLIFFHSCISPVTLCIRIVRIRRDCFRVLKKIWYCCCRK